MNDAADLKPNLLLIHRPNFVCRVDENPGYKLRNKLAIVNSSGTVIWATHGRLKSRCDLNLRQFPFDTQHCYLPFAPWSYDRSLVNISLNPTSNDHHRQFIQVSAYLYLLTCTVMDSSWQSL